MKRLRSERGAVAVEFALVLFPLVVLLLGIIEFGLLYNAQITLTNAAREGARTMVITNDPAAAKNAVKAAAPYLDPAVTDAQISVEACSPGANSETEVSYPYPFVTGFFADSVTLTGVAVMRCGG